MNYIDVLGHPATLLVLSSILSGSIGAYFGGWMAVSHDQKRLRKTTEAFYSEFYFRSRFLKGWMKALCEEFNNPVRRKRSGYLEFDLGLVETYLKDMILLGGLLSQDQRFFINNISLRMDTIKREEEKRNERIKVNDEYLYVINKKDTAYLIRYVGETIYYIEKFYKERKDFKFDDDRLTKDQVKSGIDMSGVVLSDKDFNELLDLSRLND